MKFLRIIFSLTLLLTLLSCGGGSSSSGDGSGDDFTSDNTSDDSTQIISGFDFLLKQGDFWEFEWDYYTSSVSSSGGSSGTRNGIFRITLGAPVTVADLTAYPLIMSGNNRSGINGVTPFITPRWTHIAILNNQLMLSSDGVDFKTVFDANTGFVVGYGFFEILSEQNLFEISEGTIDNDYITGSAYVLTDSASESNCEFFPSIGETICGADTSVDFTMIRREFYQPSIGPVGYFHHFSASTGGTFDSVHITRTTNIGLVASSTRGDVVDYALETESNNTPATASTIGNTSFPFKIQGDFSYQEDIDVSLPANYATNHYLYLNARPEAEPDANNSLDDAEVITLNESVTGNINSSDIGEFRSFTIPGYDTINTSIEDWYRYQVPVDARPFQVLVDFFGAADGVDIDVWLFNQSGNILDYSVDSNTLPDGSDDSEIIPRADLVTGTYYIGIDIWPDPVNASARASAYTLSLNKPSFGSEPAVTNQVAIKDFYRFSLNMTTAIIITSTPSIAIFVTDVSGETVYASAPSTVDAVSTQTVLVTPILQPGDYLVALGSQNYHYAEENFLSDTYQITIDAVPTSAQ